MSGWYLISVPIYALMAMSCHRTRRRRFPGPYRVRNYRVHAAAVLTNKTPSGTMRAPGMFEANFARERAIDLLADTLLIDRVELRRRNLIPPAELPWAVGTESVRRPTVFDSGDFPAVFERAVAEFGWSEPLPPGQGSVRRGRGIAALVEPSGLGPFEGARLDIDPHGNIQVIERLLVARPGTRNKPCPGCRRGAARADRAHHGTPRRYRADPFRRRLLCQPHRRDVRTRSLCGGACRQGKGNPRGGEKAGSGRARSPTGEWTYRAGRRARFESSPSARLRAC